MNRLVILIVIIGFSFFNAVLAQDIEKIAKKELIQVHGGVNFNTTTFTSSGLSQTTRDPFAWVANGNLNFNILGVSVPFTYSLTNRGGKYTQPPSIIALHPTYKWVKSHIGVVSMNFSPYSLAGHLFTGVGVELSPKKKWKMSAMYGRLNKTINYNPLDDNINEIAYKRMGYGFKGSFSDKNYEASLIVFKASDQANSLNFIPLNSMVKPQDNIVVTIGGKATIAKNISIEGEYAESGLTQNLNDIDEETGFRNSNFMSQLIATNSTTQFFSAYKTALTFKQKNFSISANYEHVDPGYKTLGGYYFNNDLENYTLAPSFSLFKRKLNFSINTGFQINNLSNDKANTTQRWIGSATVNYMASQKMTLTGSYSNFSTYTRNRPATDPFYFAPADTMNFYQITQNMSGMISYRFGNKQVPKSLTGMYSYNQNINLTGGLEDASAFGINASDGTAVQIDVHAANANYSLNFVKAAMAITLSSNYNLTKAFNTTSSFIGPGLTFRKSLFDKKTTLSLGSIYNRNYKDDVLSNNVWNHKVSIGYTPKFKNEKIGKFKFSLNTIWMQKLPTVATEREINELTVFANINYNF